MGGFSEYLKICSCGYLKQFILKWFRVIFHYESFHTIKVIELPLFLRSLIIIEKKNFNIFVFFVVCMLYGAVYTYKTCRERETATQSHSHDMRAPDMSIVVVMLRLVSPLVHRQTQTSSKT